VIERVSVGSHRAIQNGKDTEMTIQLRHLARKAIGTALVAAVAFAASSAVAVQSADAYVRSPGGGAYGWTEISCLYRGKVKVTVSVSGDRYAQKVGAAVAIYDYAAGQKNYVFPYTTQVVNQPLGYEGATATWSFRMNVPAYSRSWFWADYRWDYPGWGLGGGGEWIPVDC
jgi:hypothetical protein